MTTQLPEGYQSFVEGDGFAIIEMDGLVIATREPGRYNETLAKWIHVGGSPRATIALDAAARARAWLVLPLSGSSA